jgi:hypothetical protein
MILTNLEFRRLFAALTERVKDACEKAGEPVPKTQEEWMGYKDPNMKKINMNSLIKNSSFVIAYLKKYNKTVEAFSINDLYNATRTMKKGEDIEFRGIYEQVYFLVFDGKTREEFFKEFPMGPSVIYHGWYYSQSQQVKSFELTIRQTFDDEYYASVKGFHNQKEEIVLIGSMTSIESSWLVATRSKDPFLYLDISIHKGNNLTSDAVLLSNANFFKGIIHSINGNRDPIALECFFLRQGIKDYEASVLNIKRYLNLTRNHFQVRMDEFLPEDESIDKLRIQQSNISHLTDLTDKYFQILTYNFLSGEILRSKLHIREDFTGLITDLAQSGAKGEPKVQEHECRLSINNFHMVSRLLLEVKDNAGEGFSTFTIIEIPDKVDAVIHGAFCTHGGQKLKPVGGLFVMSLTKASVEPRTYSRRDAQLETDAETKLLIHELLRVHGISTKKASKKKAKPQRKKHGS